MRLARPRFTVRRMMVGVAVLAIVIAHAPWTSDAFKFAADSKNDIDDRLVATSKLSESEKRQLAKFLSSQLPGNWDIKTLDAIEILGKVGDADTIKRLEWLEAQPVEMQGRIGFTIRHLVQEIRMRNGL